MGEPTSGSSGPRAGRATWGSGTWRDLRHAARHVGRYPLAAGVAVLSLGAGVGSTVTTLMARDALFHNPPPLYAQPEQLSRIALAGRDGRTTGVPAALWDVWRARATAGHDVRLAALAAARGVEARVDRRVRPLSVQRVTPELFDLVGVAPAIGRTFDAAEGRDASAVIIAHHVWQDVFAGRPDAIGQTLVLDGEPCRVVGVMPARFWVSSMETGAWRVLETRTLAATERLEVIARAGHADGRAVTPAATATWLTVAMASSSPPLIRELRDARVVARPVAGTPLGDQIAPYVIWLLEAAVLGTLLIACVNVAVLMMAQWTLREREIAVCAALGATRGRLVRGLLAESLLIAGAGGALGVSLTLVLRGLLLRNADALRFVDLSIDLPLVLQMVAVIVGAGLLTGIGPALHQTGRQARAPGSPASTEPVRQRASHALVVLEIAVTGALLVVTGAMVSAYARSLSYDPGFDSGHVIVASVEHESALSAPLVLDRAARAAGVVSVAASDGVPLAASGRDGVVSLDAAATMTMRVERIVATPGFLATLGMRPRLGRDLTAFDTASTTRVAIVNQIVADRVGADAVGRRIWIDGEAHEIVGTLVARSATALGVPHATVYLPLAQQPGAVRRLQITARTSGEARASVAAMRDALRAIGGVQVGRVWALSDVQAVASSEILASTLPMAPLIATAMLLASMGVYGILAFAVTRRAREIAVRVALGATRRDIGRMVAAHGAALAAAGAIAGVGLSWALTRLAQGMGGIFDGPGWQAFAAPLIVLAALATVAAWLPARRAMRTDPAVLLRES